MKSRVALSILVITMLLGSAAAFAGERVIDIYINGNILYAPAPPQIINGRVMVPLRFIAEALDCEVTWDEAASKVMIESKNNKPAGENSGTGSGDSTAATGKAPVIEGTDEFKEIIEGVLALAKEKDVELYEWYTANADKIKLGPISKRVLAMNIADPFTDEIVVLLDEETFKTAKSKYTNVDELKIFYAGLLAHECAHTTYFGKNLFSDDDVEALCSINAARAVERVSNKDNIFFKYFMDDVKRHTDL